jgi:hypothetical protein
MQKAQGQNWARIGLISHSVIAALFIGVIAGGFGHSGFLGSRAYGADQPQLCTSGALPAGDGTKDLAVIGPCTVAGGTYQYKNVNIYKDVSKGGDPNGGSLTFLDARGAIDFWANSIIVENHGALLAGVPVTGTPVTPPTLPAPFMSTLTIHLYGVEQPPTNNPKATGVACKTPVTADSTFCGIPIAIWNSNPTPNPNSCITASNTSEKTLPGGVDDCFYQYKPLPYDDADPNAFFGYKVLAVSYGGTLQLFGAKGAIYCKTNPCSAGDPALNPSNTGVSWVRLSQSLLGNGMEKSLVVADPNGLLPSNWAVGDQIVVTSTDYLPGHSELLTIASPGVVAGPGSGNSTVNVVNPSIPSGTIQWPHNGQVYQLTETAHKGISRLSLGFSSIDTRASVALLSRNIKIVSDDTLLAASWPAAPGAFFGGHTIFRQGFKSVQVQGVEFYQLGQGGRLGHYPVHFHLVRTVPPDTFVKDSSAWDSMTRWFAIHGARKVTLQRDVGYLSIGHGFYFEDGTETDNQLYANIGIFARAAILNPQNPRQVPGLLASPFPTTVNVPCGDNTCPCNPQKTNVCGTPQEQVPYHSDIDHPTDYWIMNGWNKFEYNMANGAGTCGFCYWLVPGYIGGPSASQYWGGYSGEQRGKDRFGMAPLEDFYGNTCSTAMNSFNVVGNTSPCSGVVWNVATNLPRVMPVTPDPKLVPTVNAANPSKLINGNDSDTYYPHVEMGGGHFGTRCSGADCSTVHKCASGAEDSCTVTVLDHYTSSFNWAQTNVAAVWLRPQWNLVLQSALTDVQNGGLTFVTGGDYTHSSAPPGVWELARKSVFVGTTQPTNPWASNAGPFNKNSGLTCDLPFPGSYCLSANQGISMPLDNFAMNQRFFNIYDGPSHEDSNGYLDITPTTIGNCQRTMSPDGSVGNCTALDYMYEMVRGLPQDTNKSCYLPNAAIAWKQPNGFYYPPAFHSQNLFYDNVGIRHYVIEPSFLPNGGLCNTAPTTPCQQDSDCLSLIMPPTPGKCIKKPFQTDLAAVKTRYCNYSFDMFNNFSDVDRQTELNDDDGSLTGFIKTISVNQDAFFNAPYATTECESDISTAVPTEPNLGPGTATTSPYDYVSTVIFPSCASDGPNNTPICDQSKWASDCSNNTCFGVPLYRELATGTEKSAATLTNIRMSGEDFFQRNTLTVNNGVYYMDTTVPKDQQLNAANPTVFEAGHTYNVFFLFAKPSTTQTYSIYVGPGFNKDTDLKLVRADIATKAITFTSGDFPTAWTATYKNDVLTVTVNMNFTDFMNDYNDEKKASCQPQSFCTWTGSADTGSCGCNASLTDYADQNLINECKLPAASPPGPLSLCSWSVADVVCPKGGCYGFSFKLPGGFTTGTKPGLPPTPNCFPGEGSPWDTAFSSAAQSLAGTCYTPPPGPGPDFCK